MHALQVYHWLSVPTTANHSLMQALHAPYVCLMCTLHVPYAHLMHALCTPYACLMWALRMPMHTLCASYTRFVSLSLVKGPHHSQSQPYVQLMCTLRAPYTHLMCALCAPYTRLMHAYTYLMHTLCSSL